MRRLTAQLLHIEPVFNDLIECALEHRWLGLGLSVPKRAANRKWCGTPGLPRLRLKEQFEFPSEREKCH